MMLRWAAPSAAGADSELSPSASAQQTRNLSLPGAASTPSLDSLSNRLTTVGFSYANSYSIAQIRESVLPKEEATRCVVPPLGLSTSSGLSTTPLDRGPGDTLVLM